MKGDDHTICDTENSADAVCIALPILAGFRPWSATYGPRAPWLLVEASQCWSADPYRRHVTIMMLSVRAKVVT